MSTRPGYSRLAKDEELADLHRPVQRPSMSNRDLYMHQVEREMKNEIRLLDAAIRQSAMAEGALGAAAEHAAEPAQLSSTQADLSNPSTVSTGACAFVAWLCARAPTHLIRVQPKLLVGVVA